MTYALQGVMRGGGTAASANPDDGTPIMGKTGTTDNSLQNWLVTSTSKVSSATWVGNVSGKTPLRSLSFRGVGGGNVKFRIAEPILSALDAVYGGSDFAKPPSSTLYGDQVTLPDVSGKSPAEAQKLLEALGLNVHVDSTPVDGVQPAGEVASTSPAAGKSVSNGDDVTIQLSNGALAVVPSGLTGSTVAAGEGGAGDRRIHRRRGDRRGRQEPGRDGEGDRRRSRRGHTGPQGCGRHADGGVAPRSSGFSRSLRSTPPLTIRADEDSGLRRAWSCTQAANSAASSRRG